MKGPQQLFVPQQLELLLQLRGVCWQQLHQQGEEGYVAKARDQLQ
jgi:hypothetical protein